MARTREQLRAYHKRWRDANRERLRQYQRESYRANRESRLTAQREWYRSNPRPRAKAREAGYMARFGITLDDYEMRLVRQRGSCAVCKSWDARTKTGAFHVDHCHSTGRVRGLLCGPCNQAVGLMKENADTIYAAARYIERHRSIQEA